MTEEAEELRMRDGERQRLRVLHEVSKRHITQAQAGKELGISARWVRELGKRIKERGDGAVVHGLRGKRSNHRLGEKVKARALQVYAAQKQARQWHDYGPTLAAEETGVGVRGEGRERNAAPVAAAIGIVEGAAGAGGAGACVAEAASALGRVGAMGQLYA